MAGFLPAAGKGDGRPYHRSVGTDSSSRVVDVVMALGALAALVSLVRSWRAFLDDDFTAADRQLAMQVSVFLVPPIVVLLHELGHVAAALAVGAHVAGFHYGLFEGSVLVTGRTTSTQDWFIALAGNLVSAGVGLGMVIAGRSADRARRSVRYVLIVGGLFEVAFALVGYPLLSLTSRFGDWLVIYDFAHTPVLSGATAAAHVGAVLLLWRWWRRGLRPTLFAVTHGEESRLAELRNDVRNSPGDPEAHLALATLFARQGDIGLADDALAAGAAESAEPARLHLGRARLALHRGRWFEAVVATRAGLASPGVEGDVAERLWANQGLALSQMERPEHALAAFDHVGDALSDDPRVRYGRGVARMAAGDAEGGRADLEVVVGALPDGDTLRQLARDRLDGGGGGGGGGGGDQRRAAHQGPTPVGAL